MKYVKYMKTIATLLMIYGKHRVRISAETVLTTCCGTTSKEDSEKYPFHVRMRHKLTYMSCKIKI